jgi:hypothetical protein
VIAKNSSSTSGAVPNKHSIHIQELLELEASFEGKGVLHVQKPAIRGKHDDFSDALVRSVWLSHESMGKDARPGGVGPGAAGLAARAGVGWDPSNPANWVNGQMPAPAFGAVSGRIPVTGSPYQTQRPHGALARRLRGRRY